MFRCLHCQHTALGKLLQPQQGAIEPAVGSGAIDPQQPGGLDRRQAAAVAQFDDLPFVRGELGLDPGFDDPPVKERLSRLSPESPR